MYWHNAQSDWLPSQYREKRALFMPQNVFVFSEDNEEMSNVSKMKMSKARASNDLSQHLLLFFFNYFKACRFGFCGVQRSQI